VTAEPLQAATDIVRERFPDAVAAFLGGTVLGPLRTPLSDLDIVVLRPEPAPVFRETVAYAGWTVELFVSTPATYRETVAREVAARRSPVLHMVGEGVVLAGAEAEVIAAEARALIAAGPPPVTDAERDGVRYLVSDLLDDLRGAPDPAETAFVAIRAVDATARLALLTAGWWLGTGKWLGRRLREADPATHDALVEGLRAATAGDIGPLVAAGEAVLAAAGGPLLVGYRSGASGASNASNEEVRR
jgi:hypothetical protein